MRLNSRWLEWEEWKQRVSMKIPWCSSCNEGSLISTITEDSTPIYKCSSCGKKYYVCRLCDKPMEMVDTYPPHIVKVHRQYNMSNPYLCSYCVSGDGYFREGPDTYYER